MLSTYIRCTCNTTLDVLDASACDDDAVIVKVEPCPTCIKKATITEREAIREAALSLVRKAAGSN